VRADRGALAAPSIHDRIADAEFFGDEVFFKKLANAIARPEHKSKVELGLLRYALNVLRDASILDSLDEEQRYELLCIQLELYPAEGDDPAGGLNRFIRRWQKSLRT